MPEPTRAEVERILSQRKVIGENVSWKMRPGSNPARLYLEATVLVPGTRETLQLRGTYGKKHWSYSLLLNGVPVRRCNNQHTPHQNPDGTVIRQPHKHLWDDECGDREAYIPADIDFLDVNRAFFDFLRECNISFHGN